jgi:hypothetical protein
MRNTLRSVQRSRTTSALFDHTFPSVNAIFKISARKGDGHGKWFDFAREFWRCECVCGIPRVTANGVRKQGKTFPQFR